MGDEGNESTSESNSAPTTEGNESTPEGQATGEATSNASAAAGDSSYEPFTIPDDWSVTDEDMGAFSAIAKDMDLDQENAQKLVDLFISTRQGQIAADAADNPPEDGPEQWQAQLREHKELGGDHLPQTQANIDAIMRTMSDETVKYFQESGMHFRPEIIGWLNTLGGMMQEDGVNLGGEGGGGGGEGETPAQKMFSNSGHV